MSNDQDRLLRIITNAFLERAAKKGSTAWALASGRATVVAETIIKEGYRKGGRCDSFGWVDTTFPGSDEYKRCIRAHGHPESEEHIWVEAANVEGREPLVVRWTDEQALTQTQLDHARVFYG